MAVLHPVMLCVSTEIFAFFQSLSLSCLISVHWDLQFMLNKSDHNHRGKVFNILPLKMIFAVGFL